MFHIEELEDADVFRLDILIPLIKMINLYMSGNYYVSPDEFCTILFAREEAGRECAPNLLPEEVIENRKTVEVLPEHEDIVKDLFASVLRFKSLLSNASEDFFRRHHFRRSTDVCQVMVLVYILVFRISTLIVHEASDFVAHFKITKLLSLVSYLLRPETFHLFQLEGCETFESNFVEEKILIPFNEAVPYLKDLTKGSPARAVPKSIYLPPATEEKLAALRAANRSQALNLLNDANRNAPSCSKRAKGPRTVTTERPRICKPARRKPTFKPVEIKQTVTTILRECARIAADEIREAQRLKELAEGGFDARAVVELEEEARRREREEELIRAEEKRLTALLTREGAYEAKRSLLNDIQTHARFVRKERQELYEKIRGWKREHERETMEIVERCRELERAARDAYCSMMDGKRRKAAEVAEESRQLKETLAKLREEENRRKGRLIQEMKEIQVPRSTPLKGFDPTETSGLGLLCEMSLAELKKRLDWMKIELGEEMENRKRAIREERERQKRSVEWCQEALDEYKTSRRAISPPKNPGRDAAIVVTSPKIEALRKKLDEQRARRMQL